MKKFFKKLFSRFALVALTIIVLFLLYAAAVVVGFLGANSLIVLLFPSSEKYVRLAIEIFAWLLVVLAVLHCANRDMVPETKIPWLLCIIALNVLGVLIYVTFSSHKPTKRMRERSRAIRSQSEIYGGERVSRELLRERTGSFAQVSEALSSVEPLALPHTGTKTEYFPSGEDFWKRFLGDLEGAEKYIFLEYFIIEKGVFWDSILEVLERKAKEGVEVRVLYDDIGCMGRVGLRYHKQVRRKGIDFRKFNPFVPVVANIHNNRDHRKIAVIDGKVGYTGGLNLADEYVNVTHPFGHWKDCAVRLEGEGVHNLLLLFLGLWNVQQRVADDFSQYVPASYEDFGEAEGFVQPYGDGPSPMYGAHLGEDVYINILNGARQKVYIATPYLIIDYRMREALVLAAKRGVDVRIVTPHIPDKKLAFALTRSNYLALIRAGVKVYEYLPGFIHAKLMYADDEIGTVGTINLDYRSFLFHFEDGVLMYRTEALRGMGEDFQAIFSASALQTEEDAKRNVVWRFLCEVAKIFAPLF